MQSTDLNGCDCLVVGGGPAGLTAGVYLQRYHRRTVLADTGRSRALWIDRSHNYPGFPEGVAGPELLARLRRQFEDLGGHITAAPVHALQALRDGGFLAALAGVQPHALQARHVLLATGVVDAVPDMPGIDALRRRGLLRQCPICDGHEHRGQRIAVIGDGPHALREARFIAHYSADVLLLSPAAVQRVESDEAGRVLLRLGDGGTHACDVVYAALGTRPQTALATALGARLDAAGSVLVDAHCHTSVPGLWAAGDVVSGLDQLVVAAAQGAIAATAIHNRLLQEPQPARAGR